MHNIFHMLKNQGGGHNYGQNHHDGYVDNDHIVGRHQSYANHGHRHHRRRHHRLLHHLRHRNFFTEPSIGNHSYHSNDTLHFELGKKRAVLGKYPIYMYICMLLNSF